MHTDMNLQAEVQTKASFEAQVTRGKESWAFIYIMLGFAITIESTVIAMVEPLRYPWNIIAYGIIAAATVFLFLNSGWFQNKLIGWKAKYENKSR